MELFTSYYTNMPNIKDAIFVSIQNNCPYHIKTLYALSPDFSITLEYCRTHDKERYAERYRDEILKYVDYNKIIKELRDYIAYKDCKRIVLVCGGKANDFSYRHLVAEWFRENGFKVKEYEGEKY